MSCYTMNHAVWVSFNKFMGVKTSINVQSWLLVECLMHVVSTPVDRADGQIIKLGEFCVYDTAIARSTAILGLTG